MRLTQKREKISINSQYEKKGNVWTAECIEKLGTYEDAEEQGLLFKLPSKEVYESSGDTVYYIFDYEIVECINCGISIDCDGKMWIALACDEHIFPYRRPIAGIDMDPTDWCKNTTVVSIDEWRKTVFLTKEEAEQALKKMESEEQPTAYDIERVVAELKEWTFNADVNLGDGTVKNSDLIASKNAIEIVKRGIVSDDDVCEWHKTKNNNAYYKCNTHAEIHDSRVLDWCKCPYCGKKIKVVE